MAPKGRIPGLDGLRAISIGLVLLGHLTHFRAFPPALSFVAPLANFGVRIFFVISGYLITTLLLDESKRNGSISLSHFYVRRALRILPAFWVYVAFVFFLWHAGIVEVRTHDFAAASLYWMNFHVARSWILGHIWSLSVEEQFYIVWPFVLAILGIQPAKKVLVSVIVLAPVLRMTGYLLFPHLRPYIGESFFTVADSLGVGCFMACTVEERRRSQWYVDMLRSPLFPLIPAAAVACMYSRSSVVFFGFLLSYIHLAIAVTIDWCVLNAATRPFAWLHNRIVVSVGVLSYSLYLWQELFLDATDQRLPSCPLLLRIAAMVLCAILSYRLVELPFLRLKDTWSVLKARRSLRSELSSSATAVR